MIRIPLTGGRVAIIDDADAHLAAHRWRAWHPKHACPDRWYAVRTRSRTDGDEMVFLHREVLYVPDGMEVDHVDRDGLNCRRDNLRAATHAQNLHNRGRQKNSRSGLKGVHWARRERKWVAQIAVNGRRVFLGYHATAEEAARAYDAMAKDLHGEFAHLNFPEWR